MTCKTTDSEFEDFSIDEYTTLEPAKDWNLATTVRAQWWYTEHERDWQASFDAVRGALLDAFAGHDSRSLQQRVYLMRQTALTADSHVAEIHMSCPTPTTSPTTWPSWASTTPTRSSTPTTARTA